MHWCYIIHYIFVCHSALHHSLMSDNTGDENMDVEEWITFKLKMSSITPIYQNKKGKSYCHDGNE